MQITFLQQQITIWILYFFAYSIVGWLWESSYVSVRTHKWTNSGFLVGPVVPVYGFSMMALLALIEPFKQNILSLFIFSALLVTVIEYITSWLMEKLFKARWWDYSKIPLNLNGRVALPISLFWGFGVVIIVKFIHPIISRMVEQIATNYGILTVVIMIAIIMFDCGFTIANALAFGAATKRIGDTIESTKLDLKNRLAADNSLLNQNKSWLEEYRQHPSDENLSLNFVQRRLLKNFPSIKLNNTSTSVPDIIKMLDDLRKRK